MQRIKTGDTVEILSGKNAGQRGTVREYLPGRSKHAPDTPDSNNDRVVITGVNLIKKHQKRTGNVRTQVGIIEREAPVHASKVALVCKNCDKPARVGFLVNDGQQKVRYCKKCGEAIE